MISLQSDFIHIFNDFIHVYSPVARTYNPFYTHLILYMYIAQGQGQTSPWGQTFDVNRKPLSLCPFVAGLKKIALKSDFIYIFFFSCFTICI